ncbi:hypothetical protein [Neolewinella antarctica]|uniref:Uncharacterized protein n=1 Tax=Neolewinella antarctica TaxID=442734 RepID=A0ABX0XA18_9BACT|nr:hypothetical protein [Neolewinella antarctica]NJC26131.1 hypothetical protein [Neolewinella antarctica]
MYHLSKKFYLLLIVGSVIIVAIFGAHYLKYAHISKEGMVETISAVQFLLAGLLYLAVGIPAARHPRSPWLAAATILVGFGCLFIGGEELSWGQHLIGWESSEYFIENNDQQETNLHNFFNEIFDYAYPVFGILLLAGAYVASRLFRGAMAILRFPKELYILTLAIVVFCFLYEGDEYAESLLACLLLVHASIVLLRFRNTPTEQEVI